MLGGDARDGNVVIVAGWCDECDKTVGKKVAGYCAVCDNSGGCDEDVWQGCSSTR